MSLNLCMITEEQYQAFLAEQPGLQLYQHYFDKLLKKKAHILTQRRGYWSAKFLVCSGRTFCHLIMWISSFRWCMTKMEWFPPATQLYHLGWSEKSVREATRLTASTSSISIPGAKTCRPMPRSQLQCESPQVCPQRQRRTKNELTRCA